MGDMIVDPAQYAEWKKAQNVDPHEPELEFMECDTCRSKPGSPTLCAGCLHNREMIELLKKQRSF